MSGADYFVRRQPSEPDVAEFGRKHTRLASPWLTRLVLAAALLAAATAVFSEHSGTHRRSAPKAVTVTLISRPVLGVRAGWDLFLRGPSDVVDLQLARGRVITTAVPALVTADPAVSFVVGPHEAIVRSVGNMPGYEIPDGASPRMLPGRLAGYGPLVPGPGTGQVWTLAGPANDPDMELVSLAGRPVGPVIWLQRSSAVRLSAVADGRGYLMLMAAGGNTFDAGPTWYRRVRTLITAIGPTRWLGTTCPRSGLCREVVIDPYSGAARLLPGRAAAVDSSSLRPLGVVAPDGSSAAVLEPVHGHLTLLLLNLSTGASRVLAVQPNQSGAQETLAWSPDSSWLFVAAAGGRLVAVNARTGQVTGVAIQLPYVSQVVVRPAPARPNSPLG
jgi:hypothetical protein